MTDNYLEVQFDAYGNRLNPDGSLYVAEDEDSEDESEDVLGGDVSYTSATNALGEAVSVPDRSHFPDGSRTWMYSPAARPGDWPADYVDENLETVMTLGWVVPNEQGHHWTEAEAAAANAAYVEQATANYRMDDSVMSDLDDSVFDQYRQPAATQDQGMPAESADQHAPGPAAWDAPVPPDAPPAPSAPDYGWQRPADTTAGGTGYGNVMDELRQTVPQNDGRWTAEQAAAVYGDTQFAEQSGINAADQRVADAAAAYGPDGRISAEGFLGVSEASTDAARARLDAEAAPNRYQQTTGRGTEQYDEQRASLDEHDASLREQVASNPAQFGIGLSYDAQDYAARSGQTLEPGTELNAEQLAWLEQVRAAETAEAQRQQDAYLASPEGQQDQAQSDAAQARYQAQEQRFQESRARAEGRQ